MTGMRKVLIANRGEIACRVARSCRSLGLGVVAVFSEADKDALHVCVADEARLLGPASAQQSYLDGAKILAAARETGADAVHPGYGFLAEDAAFAEAVIDAGLTWIGPAPETIRAMGDKQRARDLARTAGVPIVPGTGRFEDERAETIRAAAEAVGFPLLVKATAGGGGIGMRRVDSAERLEEAVASVQNLALKAFGSGAVYLERFVPKARHIEVQVFGFGDGRAVHLYERDCSLQRRFQKIIEESPAPGLPEDVRQRMCEAALSLCRLTKYSGAGTVEYIVDAETFEFFFLEMNTRIQVEHPVTEMITGIDIVHMQLALAGNGDIDLDQEDIVVGGCAVECRLYAENPAKSFFPSPGTLSAFELPQPSDVVRIETGYREGDKVTPFYDPMIAKVIAWGESRGDALAEAVAALRATRVEGVKSNLDFLIACLEVEAFVAGDVHTNFVEDRRQYLLPAALAKSAAKTEPVT